MKHSFFYVVWAVIAIGLVVRVWLWRHGRRPPLLLSFLGSGSRGQRGRRTDQQARPGRLRDQGLLGDTGLVAARELRERLRGRLFRVITLLLLVVVGAAIVIPTLNSKSSQVQTVGVVGTASGSIGPEVRIAAKRVGVGVRLVSEPDLTAARSALRAGHLDVVVDGTHVVLVQKAIGSGDTSDTAQLVREVAATIGLEADFQAAGLTSAQVAAVAGARSLPVQSLQPGKSSSPGRTTSVWGLILVFVMLTQYNTWTLMGVMEEKSSRVVEVLLATVRPVQLLAGKVLGIGMAAMLQAGLLVAFALVLADAVGSNLLKGTAPLVLVATLAWLVLGYAFYCWVYAAAGSMAERQDQVQSMALPLSVPIIFVYILALTTVGSGTPSTLFKVLAFVPPTAPFAMPVLVGLGDTTWWQFGISALISIASTVAVARVAAAIYRRAVLRTGRRVGLRELARAFRGT